MKRHTTFDVRRLSYAAVLSSLLSAPQWAELPLPGAGGLDLALHANGPASSARRGDAGDDAYRVLAGLVDKGLYDMAVEEGERFLRDHARHAKADLARYRLATALFETARHGDARAHYAPLARKDGFEYRAESAFRLGQCELEEGALDDAARSFGTVLALDQDYLHAAATFFLAETEFRRGNVEEAEASYRRVAREFAPSEHASAARRGLAWCAWTQGDVDATIERTKRFLDAARNEAADAETVDEMRVLLGEALLEAGRAGDALAAFEAVSTEAFGDARRRGAGFAHAANGAFADAAREFALLVRDFPNSRFKDEAVLQVGIQTLRAGDAGTAVRALSSAAANGDPEALYWLAQAQLAADDAAGALKSAENALRRTKDEDLAGRLQTTRGDALTALGRSSEAAEAYRSGGSDYALFAAAVAGLNDGAYDRALQAVNGLLEAHPETKYRAQALVVAGEAHFAAERWSDAEQAFADALAGSPEPAIAAQALGRVGWCKYRQDDLAGAAEVFGRLVRRYANEDAAEQGQYMLGRVLLESGDAQGALRACNAYLERYDEGEYRDDTLLAAAQAAGEGDDARGAIAYLRRLVDEEADGPLVAEALLELGDRSSEQGDMEQASAAYGALLAAHGESELAPRARYGLAWCRYGAGEFEEAARLLSAVGADGAADATLREAAWELCVWARSKNGDAAGAADAWARFASLSRDEPRVFEGLRTVVATWRDAGRAADAQTLLDRYLARVSDDGVAVDVLLESAYLALETGDVDRAEARVEVALDRAGRAAKAAEATEAAFFVGEARFDADALDRAAKLYEAAASEAGPLRPNALYKLGFSEMKRGELDAAARAFSTVASEYAEHELWGESLFLLGEVYYRSDRFDDAIAAFDRLLREAPNHEVSTKALFRMGVALGKQERWAECESALTRLAKRDGEFPNLTEAELWRGRALAAQKKRRAARQAFERVMADDGGELAAQARLGMGRLLEDEGNVDEALSEYLKVAFLYAHDEEVAEALFRAGTCLERLGDRDKALEQYEEVLAEHPKTRFAKHAEARVKELRS